MLRDDFCPVPLSIDTDVALAQAPGDLALPDDFSCMEGIAGTLVKAGSFVGAGAPLRFVNDSFNFGAPADVIDLMRILGMLQLSNSEFGELELAIDPRHISWHERNGLQMPSLLLLAQTTSEPLKKHKPELIIMLHSAGWKASVGQLEPCTNDNACEYECSLHRPAS
jgi:hypothetical protein